MSKKILEAEFQKIERSDRAEQQFKHFVLKWWQPILYSLGGLILITVLLYQFTRGSEASAVQDYLKADQTFTEFSAAKGEQIEEKLVVMKKLLAKYPELKAKYDGKIAQVLLSKNKPALAESFALSALTSAKKEGKAPYQNYSETSLQIARGKYAEALQEAKALQSSLPQTDTLFAFNLLRIATLESELGNQQAATKIYKDILQMSEANPFFISWLDSFKEGELTYRQYLEGLVTN